MSNDPKNLPPETVQPRGRGPWFTVPGTAWKVKRMGDAKDEAVTHYAGPDGVVHIGEPPATITASDGGEWILDEGETPEDE